MGKSLGGHGVFLLVVGAVVCAVYALATGNALVFDDDRLVDGTIFGSFGSLAELRPRLISYGSFVWVHALFGEGWQVQRVVNLLFHLGVGLGAWRLMRGLIDATRWEREDADPPSAASLNTAAAVGVALFLANPVAVYAVGYLVQRSIVMAAFFAVWSLVAVIRVARGGSPAWWLAACLLYVSAVLSKEHAALLPLPAFALFAIVRRPPARVVVGVGVAALLLAGAFAVLVSSFYAGVLGQVFDERSTRFIGQLDALRPGVQDRALALSIANQGWLFFRYTAMWVVPNVMWMSVDLRPPFPLGFTSFPQVLGLPLYLALLAGSVLWMARHRDWRQFLGFAMFLPATLFATEFATVWVQDPFVLYRSYLWALGLPLLLAFPFIGARPRTIAAVGSVLVVVFAGLSFERLQSFRSNATLWADAAAKHPLDAPPQAVGRGRAYMWRGNDAFVSGMFTNALQDYDRALQAGEPRGQVQYHRAAALKMLGQDEAALRALDASAAAGGDPVKPASVDFLRAQILAGLGRPGEAATAADEAVKKGLDTEERVVALNIAGQAYARQRIHDKAATAFAQLLELQPANRSARVGHALSLNALGRREQAVAELDALLDQGDGADVRFGRAMVLATAGRRAEALQEARRALALKPGDPALSGLVAKLEGS